MKGLRPTRAVVDLDALARNFRLLSRAAPEGAAVMPVVKADAYGHGAEEVSRRLAEEGAASFAVAVVEEGVELRRAGVSGEILVMGWIGAGQLPDLVRFGLVPNVHSFGMIADLSAFSRGRGLVLPVHLKLDTGMTRLGFRPEEVPDLAEALRRSPQLVPEGVFQNFASADDPDGGQTREQVAVLSGMLAALRERGIAPPVLHVSNSAGTLRPPEWPDGLQRPARVRPGLALYTRFPGLSGAEYEDVMTFRSVVDQVKEVPAGTRVGYGGAFVTPARTRLAIVPAGYADGVPRSLGGRGEVLVRARRCRIVGRIAMDLTAVDVTGLDPPPEHGEEVVFFGVQDGQRLGVEEAAAAAGTVSWEILCGVGPRVPRVVVEGGAPRKVVSRFFPDGDVTFHAFS
ncbi:alanine racemase [Acidobacteria bacterium ACD]|nr:MAG: alanine racemase [Acidobacteriota bacterium]MDL1950309.1 alanine racemase [Acidobacteria bacterium ACD]